MITAIRDILSNPQSSEVVTTALTETNILSILSCILDLGSTTFSANFSEEFYFLKLEALWILINLSMCDTDDIQRMLLSNVQSGGLPNITEQNADEIELLMQQDIIQQKSQILSQVERLVGSSLGLAGGDN